MIRTENLCYINCTYFTLKMNKAQFKIFFSFIKVQNSFMAKSFIGYQSTQNIFVVKVRCDKASDYTAIEDYLRLLNTNIQ